MLESRSIGRSIEGRDLTIFANHRAMSDGRGGSTFLVGGMHGDEKATISLVEKFAANRLEMFEAAVFALPLCNPDSAARNSRYNARGVDLNRNCGTNWHADSEEPSGPEPWSEMESRALRDFILKAEPAKIVSLHWALAEIDADGAQSTELAQAMWDSLEENERRPYRLRVTELGRGKRRLQKTYAACPGSLGQWCGYGLRYADGSAPAMITLELPFDSALPARPEELPTDHLETLRKIWSRDSEGYLRAVEPGVFKMLDAACAL